MRGRKLIECSPELQEEYVKIYFNYHFLKLPWFEICQKFNCKKSKVYSAIKWVSENELKLPAKTLIAGAIFAVRERLRRNTDLWEKEHGRPQPSIRNIVELTRELREDSKQLFELQKVYSERFEIELTGDRPLTSAEVLKLIMTKDKEANPLNGFPSKIS